MNSLKMSSSLKNKFSLLEQLRQEQPIEQPTEEQPKVGFLQSVGQSVARSFVATGAFLWEGKEGSYTPQNETERKIFGTDQPISFKTIGEETLAIGGEDFKRKWGSFAVPVGMLMAGLDITPIGGGKSSVIKNAVKAIAKTQDATEIARVLKTIVKGTDAEIGVLAKSLKMVNREGDVMKVITQTGRLKAPLVKEAITVEKGIIPQELQAKVPKLIPKRVIPPISEKTIVGFQGAVSKANDILKTLRPDIKKVQSLYSAERAKRFGKMESFISKEIDTVGGEEGYAKILSMFKGELVGKEAKMLFEPLKNKLNQGELKSLFQGVWKHPYLTNGEKLSTANGLKKILTGELPQAKQLVLMEEVFGTDLIKTILSKRVWGKKAMETFTEIINIPRVALATADMSAFLRQGIIEVIAHPIISAKAIAKTFEFAFNPKTFVEYFQDLSKESLFKLMRDSNLAITDPAKIAGGIGAREEAFISRFLQKIPILRIPVTFSERAYSGFLTKLRVDIFKSWADELLSKGLSPVKDADQFRAMADVINTFTGRGATGTLDRIAPQLSVAFFSPRLIAARFNAMNPVWYAQLPKEIRKKAIMDFSKFVGVGTSLLGLINIYKEANNVPDSELSLEIDPRSSDFGKIKIGNTRFDMWGGFQQWARVIAQISTGERKDTKSGKIISLSKEEYPFTTRRDVLYSFVEGKLAPVPALVKELMDGAKTFTGDDMTLKSVATEKFIPMYIQDIGDAYADGGLGRAVGGGGAAFFGVGVQTYGKPTKRKIKGGGGLKMPPSMK